VDTPPLDSPAPLGTVEQARPMGSDWIAQSSFILNQTLAERKQPHAPAPGPPLGSSQHSRRFGWFIAFTPVGRTKIQVATPSAKRRGHFPWAFLIRATGGR